LHTHPLGVQGSRPRHWRIAIDAARHRLRFHTHIVCFVAPVVGEYMTLCPEVAVDLTMGERMAHFPILAKAMGGQPEIESERGIGTIVRVTLPVASDECRWRGIDVHRPGQYHGQCQSRGEDIDPDQGQRPDLG
jgi:hypothetical protein